MSFLLAAVLGYALLHKRVGRLGLVETGRALGRLVLAAALAAVPAWLPVVVLRHEIGDGKAASGLTLAAGGLVLIGGYAAAAYALRIRDVTEVLAMIKGRFRG